MKFKHGQSMLIEIRGVVSFGSGNLREEGMKELSGMMKIFS